MNVTSISLNTPEYGVVHGSSIDSKIVLALFTTSLFLGSTARAETLICENGFCVLGPADVVDDVLILDGGILLMDGATITGNIEIELGGVLAASRSTIKGQIQSEFAFLIDLTLCDVGGKVQLDGTGGSGDLFGLPPSISIQACQIAKSLKVTRSKVSSIIIRDNVIGGKLELSRNVTARPITLENNTVLRR